MERNGLSLKKACLALKRHPSPHRNSPVPASSWSPLVAKAPRELWQMKAKNFLTIAMNSLWSKQGEPIREWLKAARGLSEATIKKSMFGYSPMDIDEPRSAWGLEPLFQEGAEHRQWIPKGLAIPVIQNNKVMRIRIRQDNPSDGPRYALVSGSSDVPLNIGQDKGAIIIVGSELDAWLLSQEVGDLCAVVALGNAQVKPDRETDKILHDASVILFLSDLNDTGSTASWIFWRDNYQAKRWPIVKGKDANEARLNGLDLRAWIIAGLFGKEENFERFCIHTIEGGMSDKEALMMMGL